MAWNSGSAYAKRQVGPNQSVQEAGVPQGLSGAGMNNLRNWIGDGGNIISQNKGAYNSALSALQGGVPKGLSQQQMGNMKAQISGGAAAGANQGLANMRRQLGGASPLMAAMGGQMQAAAAASAAAQISDVERQEVMRMQDLENTRRSQLVDLSGVGAQFAGIGSGLKQHQDQMTQGWSGMALQHQYDAAQMQLQQQTAQSGMQNDRIRANATMMGAMGDASYRYGDYPNRGSFAPQWAMNLHQNAYGNAPAGVKSLQKDKWGSNYGTTRSSKWDR